MRHDASFSRPTLKRGFFWRFWSRGGVFSSLAIVFFHSVGDGGEFFDQSWDSCSVRTLCTHLPAFQACCSRGVLLLRRLGDKEGWESVVWPYILPLESLPIYLPF